jgi:conjugative transposon TraM protein
MMHAREKSPRGVRRQKIIWFLLPVMIIPFTTLGFWSFTGGSMDSKADKDASGKLILQVPGAQVNENNQMSKMELYKKKDKELQRNSEAFTPDGDLFAESFDKYVDLIDSPMDQQRISSDLSIPIGGSKGESPSQEIYQRIALLQEQLQAQEAAPYSYVEPQGDLPPSGLSREIDRLDEMMQTMVSPSGEDHELKQISGILEKILEIQHPDRHQARISDSLLMHQPAVYTIIAREKGAEFGSLVAQDSLHRSGFYSLSGGHSSQDETGQGIRAVVHGSQTLVNGATVKLRLTQEASIAGYPLAKDHFLNGVVQLRGDRLQVSIKSILVGQSVFPVDLELYDMDGLEGIYIPGSIDRDVAKNAMDRSIQGVDLRSLDLSLGAQAVSSGVEAAKNLISQKAKLVRVRVKDGYQVILQQKN